jgi:hypothetical protein
MDEPTKQSTIIIQRRFMGHEGGCYCPSIDRIGTSSGIYAW